MGILSLSTRTSRMPLSTTRTKSRSLKGRFWKMKSNSVDKCADLLYTSNPPAKLLGRLRKKQISSGFEPDDKMHFANPGLPAWAPASKNLTVLRRSKASFIFDFFLPVLWEQ